MKTTFSDPGLLKKAAELVSAREQLQTALREAEAALPVIETQLQACRVLLSDQEVKVALDISESESSTGELAALNQALLERERARARVAGLESKLADQEVKLNKTLEELTKAQSSWSRDIWNAFLHEHYRPALATFMETLNRGRSIASALGVSATLPNTTDFLDLPNVTPSPEFALPLQTLHTLRRFSSDARSRREFQEKQATFAAPFDPGGVFTIMGDCRVNGVPHKTGDLVTAREIPLELLEKLHRTRKVKLVPVSDYVHSGG